ncbi:GDSL esterase/lipase At5g62930-like [Arachis stenosperma]|uniref:GDSL esterase/lipase At5g62930-like n=1 Tax=Arachis stenosperma TaxID=217475 RepID=UPI0025AB73B0|nr:GDSL esterase/lipase At5g62930-like [Arachis stenosperma]
MRGQIMLFGDSITEQSFRQGGWGAALANAYCRQADVVLRGYAGYNTKWALFLLNRIFPLDSSKPRIATTIFFGANDAALSGRTNERFHVPIEDYKQNLRKIVLHLKECSPTMLIVLITPPPFYEERRHEYLKSLLGENAPKLSERTNEVTGQYARACIETAKEMGVMSVDLWSKMQETDDWQNKFLIDGLHLTTEGNAIVYQEVIKVFNEAGLSADNMPFDFPNHSDIDAKNPEEAFQQKCFLMSHCGFIRDL